MKLIQKPMNIQRTIQVMKIIKLLIQYCSIMAVTRPNVNLAKVMYGSTLALNFSLVENECLRGSPCSKQSEEIFGNKS